MRQTTIERIIGWSEISLAVVIAISATFSFARTTRFNARAKTAQAKVVATEKTVSQGLSFLSRLEPPIRVTHTSQLTVIRFVTESGRAVRVQRHAFEQLSRGDRLTVFYDPLRPDNVRLSLEEIGWFHWAAFFLLVGGFAAIGYGQLRHAALPPEQRRRSELPLAVAWSPLLRAMYRFVRFMRKHWPGQTVWERNRAAAQRAKKRHRGS